MITKVTSLSVAAGVAALALLTGQPAMAQFGMDRDAPKHTATPELPQCARAVGTVAIREPEHEWWTQYGLSNPEALIKLMALRSGCLRVVDRNGGLAMRNTERSLADSGELQRGSNIGRGQLLAADYVIIPDLVNSNENAGGTNFGAIAGSLIPGGAGALLGGIKTRKSQAQAIITLMDSRTSEQLYIAEGTSQKTDVGFNIGGGAFGGSGFGGADLGGYANTDIGKVVTAAYFNAFVDLVHHMQGMMPGEAAAEAPTQAYTVTQAAILRLSPSPKAKIVRSFKAGDLVYPTGQKNGVWWEADDENGNRGWVSSALISPRGGH